MGRKDIYRAAQGPFALSLVRAAIARGDKNPLAAARGVKLPEDRDEVRILADTCVKCGEQGHKQAVCPTMECHLCGGFGHMKRRCPERAK